MPAAIPPATPTPSARRAICALMTGDAAVTVIVSATALTLMLRVMRSVLPETSVSLLRAEWNPSKTASMSYSPARSRMNENAPRPSVTAVCFSGPVIVTVTPGSTAPLESVTTPLIAPNSTCKAIRGTTNAATTTEAQMRVRMASPPRQAVVVDPDRRWHEALRKARASHDPDIGFRHQRNLFGRRRESTL